MLLASIKSVKHRCGETFPGSLSSVIDSPSSLRRGGKTLYTRWAGQGDGGGYCSMCLCIGVIGCCKWERARERARERVREREKERERERKQNANVNERWRQKSHLIKHRSTLPLSLSLSFSLPLSFSPPLSPLLSLPAKPKADNAESPASEPERQHIDFVLNEVSESSFTAVVIMEEHQCLTSCTSPLPLVSPP